MIRFSQILLLFAFTFPGLVFAQTGDKEARLLRFPAAYGNQVVFTYAGDLYSVPRSGGVARKLSNHSGMEMFAKFSPDGTQIAFTGQYDGNTEVYVMPSTGGAPKRITYTATLGRDDVSDRMGPNNIVMDWTPDGKEVLYRTRATTFNAFKGNLMKAPVSGELSSRIPLSFASWASYHTDGKTLFHNRVFREFRTWKYYKGGQADDIWMVDLTNGKTENLSNNSAQDIFPMYHNEKVYYCSDRDRIMNLFEYDLKTKQTRKVTQFTEYDVKFPSLNGDLIAFENGGYIYLYDLKTNQQSKVTVQVQEDFAVGRNKQMDATKNINGVGLAPDGARAVFSARGDIFTVPAKNGVVRNLTQSSNAHDRDMAWSPDGIWIAYVSDRSGEDEVYIQKQDGSEPATAVSSGGGPYKYRLLWSPDSKMILLSDRSQNLYYYDVQSKKKTNVKRSGEWEITDFSWSPDNKWIAYTNPNQLGTNRIHLYNLVDKTDRPATDEWYNAFNPRFSPDGKYLYFVSTRDYNPTYSNTEWNHAYVDMAKIYVLHLSNATASLFKNENDEVNSAAAETPKKEAPAAESKASAKDKAGAKPEQTKEPELTVKVDWEGIQDRVESLPLDAGNYFGLQPTKDGIYYRFAGFNKPGTVKYMEFKDKKEKSIGAFGTFILSHDHKKVLLSKGPAYYIEDAPKGELDPKNKLDMTDVKMTVDRKAEWSQIYYESWRQMRDFFYDPEMHGVDWAKIRDKYAALLPHVNHRNDLTYLIGEMIGELNVGHAYVNDGDRPERDIVSMGLLGGAFERHSSGYYQIKKILKGASWSSALKSPLNEIGLNIKEGDFIIAINGNSVKNMSNIYEGLVGKAGVMVELTVNSQASESGARKVYVKPVSSEADLYYADWIQANIDKVDKASGGKIGYIHVPDMGPAGLNAFSRYFYPQLEKEALIIDDRGNGGGNVSPMLIERLRRELVFGNSWRNGDRATTRPAQIHLGPKVCLIDQYSASDGDLFPYQFKHYKIGKVIGQRSWGGVVGIRGSLPFVDGGDLRKPEFAHFDPVKNEFVIEGYGVDPDIEVINDPYQEYLNNDTQLTRAVEELLKELKENPVKKLTIPPFPKKNK